MGAFFFMPLDDGQWAIITAHLPQTIRGRVRTKEQDYRAFVNAVLWVVGNDACWKSVPCDRWRAIYVRFTRWVDQGLWDAVEYGIGSDQALVWALRARVALYSTKRSRRRTRSAMPSAERPDASPNPVTADNHIAGSDWTAEKIKTLPSLKVRRVQRPRG